MTKRALACPGCGKRMVVASLKGVTIDRCEHCLGIYFDAGELAKAAGCAVPPLFPGTSSERSCPACAEPFRLGLMGHVAVDVCDECMGIYLDGGEFRTLRKGRAPVRTKPRQMLDDDSDMHTGGMAALLILGILASAGD